MTRPGPSVRDPPPRDLYQNRPSALPIGRISQRSPSLQVLESSTAGSEGPLLQRPTRLCVIACPRQATGSLGGGFAITPTFRLLSVLTEHPGPSCEIQVIRKISERYELELETTFLGQVPTNDPREAVSYASISVIPGDLAIYEQ